MAECGNMPDWHPYNTQQGGRTSAPSGAQNASTGHMFISSISPPALDGMNLSAESRHQTSKHQTDPGGFVARNYQPGGPIPASNCPTSSSLTSAVHMSPMAGCVSHYGASSTRNPMMDGLGGSMDPRMGSVGGMAEDVTHRNSQMPFAGPTGHPNPSSIGVNPGNPIHSSTMAPQNSPVGSMSPGRQPPGFGSCKGPCCNPDASIPYQHWDKYGHYQSTSTGNAYRDNIRQPSYPMDNRRFLQDMNMRKECLEAKELEPPSPFPVEHRRPNFPDYKYRKDNVIPRNYPTNGSNILQSYPMQNYNFPNEYQKCPYSVKDYMRRGSGSAASINSKNSSLLKYQEQQQQNAIAQQKYQHSKQMQYQNGSVMPGPGIQNPSAPGGMPSPLQNSYYNGAQMPRDLARNYSREYQQEQSVVTNPRIVQQPSSHVHNTFPKYHQVYHQKIAMQRYSVENHLRAFSRIPGYQSHPKYQECVMRYRELLRLQQTVDYQNVLQEAPKIPSPSNPTTVPPINLQFDQNGILINSNYMPPGYSGIHSSVNPISGSENPDPSANARIPAPLEPGNQFSDHSSEPHLNLPRDLDAQMHQNPVGNVHETHERYYVPGDKNSTPGRYENERTTTTEEQLNPINAEEATKSNEQRSSSSSASSAPNEAVHPETVEYTKSKDFADKPELDVRQFLANWDESEDEEAAGASTQEVSVSQTSGEPCDEVVFSSKTPESSSQVTDPVVEPSGKENNEENSGSQVESATEPGDALLSDRANESQPTEIRYVRSDEGADEIPTIHIVDSLEGNAEMEKIHTVFGSLASAMLNPISMAEASSEGVGEGETIVLFEQGDGVCAKTLEFSVPGETNGSESVEGVIASIIDSSEVRAPENAQEAAYKSPGGSESRENDQLAKETTIPTSNSSSGSSSSTNNSPTTTSNSTKLNSEESSNLRKQNSFASDESHNPDDISLPDLQTSECTPISTTLNTPIHSDSEESSEHVSDLTISTNPIEIVQNSPIISFTHSPIKIEPYEQLDDARLGVRTSRQRDSDSLDFDFDREVACRQNEKYNETTEEEQQVRDALEGPDRETTDSMLLEDIRESYGERESRSTETTGDESYGAKSGEAGEREKGFYRTADPLVGMAHISESKDVQEGTDVEERVEAIDSGENRAETSVDRILASDQLHTDKCPTIMGREDEFNRSEDLEKLCDMSLDETCMIPLIPGVEDCTEEPRMPVSPMEGNCLTKILNDTLPITDLDVLESGDEEKIGKTEEEDMWVEVRYMEKQSEANFSERTKGEGRKARKKEKSCKGKQEKTLEAKAKEKNEEVGGETELEERVQESNTAKEATVTESRPKENHVFNTDIQKIANKEQREECCEESRKNRESCRRRVSREKSKSESSSRDSEEERTTESEGRSTITKSFLTKHRDSNVEIQVANLNLKIHDNELIRKDCAVAKLKTQESTADSVDAIEIKINLSRGEVSGRRSQKFSEEVRRTSNQETQEEREESAQFRENAVCPSGSKCCRRRRRSVPDGFEGSKRTRKCEEERTEAFQQYTAKKIRSRRSRRVRKSMDDELLMSQERFRKEINTEERNFHLEMAKTFNLPWPRDEQQENPLLVVPKEKEPKKEKKSSSSKNKTESRLEKHLKEPRILPSPSYNSSVENSSTLDFDNFDVAPHQSTDTDPEQTDFAHEPRYPKSRLIEDRDRHRNNPTNYGSAFEDIASLDAFEINLNTVPIYTTKDGRITYSPNRNYTYRALIMEARQREGYPPIRKLHCPRLLARNHYRDPNQRKLHHKKRHEEERSEKKRRTGDYHSKTSRRTSSSRHRPEDSEPRGSRTKKHETRRKDSRISEEHLDYCEGQPSRGYPPESNLVKNTNSEAASCCFKNDTSRSLIELETCRRSELPRNEEPPEIPLLSSIGHKPSTALKNNVDLATSPRHSKSRDQDDSLVSKIFQGQEFQISLRQTPTECQERLHEQHTEFGRASRFFREADLLAKTPMASPLVNLDKRPSGWDLEQDCQTLLSDSGLESSTTYVEASKDSRRIHRWQNSFVNRVVDSCGSIFQARREMGFENEDKTREKGLKFFESGQKSPEGRVCEEKGLKFFEIQPKSPEGREGKEKSLKFFEIEPKSPEGGEREEKSPKLFESEPKNPLESTDSPKEEEVVENVKKSLEDGVEGEQNLSGREIPSSIVAEENIEKIGKIDRVNDIEKIEIAEEIEKIDKDKSRTTTENLQRCSTKQEVSSPTEGMSEIVKSLDLAISTRPSGVFSEVGKGPEVEKAIPRENRVGGVFQREKGSKNHEVLPRRASSDEVQTRTSRNIFFQSFGPCSSDERRSLEIQEAAPVLEEEEEEEPIQDPRLFEETLNQDTRLTSSEANLESFDNNCKDFLIDTSTSFSSCLKLRIPEPVSAMPTESEASRLEDTATRFAEEESMDSKEAQQSQINFSFSSQDAVHSSPLEDTIQQPVEAPQVDELTERDSFLSHMTENAVITSEDCSGKSSSSPRLIGCENSKLSEEYSSDSPPVLSFSGKIHDDSPSKSPPCLVNENLVPKLVIRKSSESSKSSPGPLTPEQLPRESALEARGSPKLRSFASEEESHPKIPKMIIRNVRSRPGTPTNPEELEDSRHSSGKEQRLFEVEIKLETGSEAWEDCKVPKMKIKLEDKQTPRMLVGSPRSAEAQSAERTPQGFPRVKIKKVRRSSSSRSPTNSDRFLLVGKLSRQASETELQLDQAENLENSNASGSYRFTLVENTSSSKKEIESCRSSGGLEDDVPKHERIPKLTIKKQEMSAGYSSVRKRHSRSPGESSSRKRKGTGSRHSSARREETRSQEMTTSTATSLSSGVTCLLENEGNTDSQTLAEKIPKVIIKRASPSAEFKCELSKVGRDAIRNDSKWQPEVKLQRSWVLDCMAKEPGGGGPLALKVLQDSLEESKERGRRRRREWKRSASDCELGKRRLFEGEGFEKAVVDGRRKSCDGLVRATSREIREKDASVRKNSERFQRASGCSRVSSALALAGEENGEVEEGKRCSETERTCCCNETEELQEASSRDRLEERDESKNDVGCKKSEKSVDKEVYIEETVIKLDSSDESQTTIEMLPVSLENSQPEPDAMEPTMVGSMGKLYSDEAIPTQFELELEIVDNSTIDSVEVPMGDCVHQQQEVLEEKEVQEEVRKRERFRSYTRRRKSDEEESLVEEEGRKLGKGQEGAFSRDSSDSRSICCSDSLVKEVLAAKETLKRCLTSSKSVAKAIKTKPRPKTAAEKKQGCSSFNFEGMTEMGDAKSRRNEGLGGESGFFQGEKRVGKVESALGMDKSEKRRTSEKVEKQEKRGEVPDDTEKVEKVEQLEKKQERHQKARSKERRRTLCSSKEEEVVSSSGNKVTKRSSSSSSTCANPSSTKSSGSKQPEAQSSGEASKNRGSSSVEASGRSEKPTKHRSPIEKPNESPSKSSRLEIDSTSRIKSYKIPKISKSRESNDNCAEEPRKEEKRETPSPAKMPVLEPQVQLGFDSAGSDRDTSRSPPVITKQEDNEVVLHNAIPKIIEESVHKDKLESIGKQETEAVTFADIVSQLAYHEKATIRHRRYCTLCERWFPTAARHRRHLTGYQHRHTELTQRRTVHALFMLFTGKPCPRLLPASIVRTDCLPGEPTPLQIAVQDVAISLEDGARVKPKDPNEKDD